MNAETVKCFTSAWADVMLENRDRLVELDSVAGDGDIGLVLSDGFAKVRDNISTLEQTDVGKLFYQVGKVLSSEAPSSMGTLLDTGFMRGGKTLRGKTEFTVADLCEMFQGFAEAMMEMGGAKEGEKTALDSLMPGLRALRDSEDKEPAAALADAAQAADEGFKRTQDMVARHGRIAVRGEASRTIADPGAAAVALLYEGMRRALA